MFGDWNDAEWCEFDNYMVGCLQSYLETGLLESQFVNLKVRQLSAETSHDFIEWCGLINGAQANESLVVDERVIMQECYYDFIQEYPDYGPKSRMTISRIRFNKWLVAYAVYSTGSSPQEGRDASGRWMRMKRPEELNNQRSINL